MHGKQRGRTLHAYKNENLARAVRQPLINGLAAVLFKWLSLHENCLAAGAGLVSGRFDTVTSVPSSGARTAPHPRCGGGLEGPVRRSARIAWLKEKRKPGWSRSTCCLH